MGIRRVYQAPATLAGEVGVQTGRGSRLTELLDMARREELQYAQLAEGQRQYDLGLTAKLQQAEQDRQFGYDQLASREDQFYAGTQADLQARQMQADAGLAQQMLQNAGYAEYQQQATERAYNTQQAQTARAYDDQRFKNFMASREAIMEYQPRMTDQQYQEAVQQWEQQSGMAWGLPDEMAAAEADDAMRARFEAIANSAISPLTGQPVMSVEQIQARMDNGATQKEIDSYQTKIMSEHRQQKANDAKAAGESVEVEKKYAEMDADDEARAAEVAATQTFNQQKFEQSRRQGLIDTYNMQVKANTEMMAAKAKARTQHELARAKAKMPTKVGDETVPGTDIGPFDESAYQMPFPNLGPAPTFDDGPSATPAPAPQSGEQPVAESREKAAIGQRYKATDGTIRERRS